MQATERMKPSERIDSSASHRARIAYLRDLRERIFAELPAMRAAVDESARVASLFARASVSRAKRTWVPQGTRGAVVERRDDAIDDLRYALGALDGAAEQIAALEAELPALLAAEAARECGDDFRDGDAEDASDLADPVQARRGLAAAPSVNRLRGETEIPREIAHGHALRVEELSETVHGREDAATARSLQATLDNR